MRGTSGGIGGFFKGLTLTNKVLILVIIFLAAALLYSPSSSPSSSYERVNTSEDYLKLPREDKDKPSFHAKPYPPPESVSSSSERHNPPPGRGRNCKDRRLHWNSGTQREAFEVIVNRYEAEWKRGSDINQHLPFLREVVAQVDTVTEMGTREIVSTWAILAGRPLSYLGIDPFRSAKINVIEKAAINAGINFTFWEKSDLEVEIPETEFLFIDTLHTYKQLKQELALHHSKATKYLGFHDTTLFEAKDDHLDKETKDPSGKVGLWPAISEFLEDHPEWRIRIRFTHNNGLTILERVYQ